MRCADTVQCVSGIFVFAYGEARVSKTARSERKKSAAEAETQEREVPYFEFHKVSYNARYTNIRGVKKPSISGFGPFGVFGIRLDVLGL